MIGVDECPNCGTSEVRTIRVHGEKVETLAACLECSTSWEPFAVADLVDRDDPYSIFLRPCDNCAFRKDSPERADQQKWDDLMIQIHIGGAAFYCHKGVPIAGADAPGESHVQPRTEDGKLDMKRMRLCAGYLNTRLRQIYRSPAYKGVPRA